MNRCTWTETITFEKFINEPYYEEIKNEQRQRQCENKSEEELDEYGRAYCKEHRIKVDEINKSRHKNCINKEKFMQYLKNTYRLNGYYEEVYKPIKTRIKDGWFDNE